MRTRFLLGPAGSGKTTRCVGEVRSALLAAPEGPPLLFLAPKQATFQIERQLLADPALPGYTRLRILSFERLARFLMETAGAPLPSLLSEEGRLMVLRALLARHRDDLSAFRATARMGGFASQLNLALRELQQHQVTPARLTRLADTVTDDPTLTGKLKDLALLLTRYREWLETHALQDADHVLDLAAETLGSPPVRLPRLPRFGGLWLDGFAEMTPQEVALLAAVIPWCAEATLAFCLDEPPERAPHWLSVWGTVGDSFSRLRERLAAIPGCRIETESLTRDASRGRFSRSAPLRHLEQHWGKPVPFPPEGGIPGEAIRVAVCHDRVGEARLAAGEILRFVRIRGGRYREAAVLVRSLDGYHDIVRRVFRRQGIPIFLDRRESVAHHPLAELTRNALRTAAFGWQHEDWFSTLKTGLVGAEAELLDRLENEALARGWAGDRWQEAIAIPENPGLAARLERVRGRVVPPFLALATSLAAGGPNGVELAGAVRRLWSEFDVPDTLQCWVEAAAHPREGPAAGRGVSAQVHREVWDQMQAWLENVERAFPTERMPLREWLPILEAGLGNLTVGVIPPALDQVLVGAVDRSRNPDLRLVIVMGLNEGVFPARPEAPRMFSVTERTSLDRLGLSLGPDQHRQLGRERYYGYIACTRPRERLVLTLARRDAQDRPLNPSSLVTLISQLFAAFPIEQVAPEFSGPAMPAQPTRPAEPLSPAIAATLYGPTVFRTSVSRLEDFASCPFKFFVAAGLRAGERKRFEVDARQRGSFQHEVLCRFHGSVRGSKQEWRDLTPEAARRRLGEVAEAVAREFEGGLLQTEDGGLLSCRALTLSLQRFVEVLVEWMRTSYTFSPRAAELAFGLAGKPLPAWEIELAGGQRLALEGKVDRVDLAFGPDPDTAWCVIMDYKSGARRHDAVLFEHGIQLQLPAYLAALCQVAGAGRGAEAGSRMPASGGPRLEVEPMPLLRPAGFFYANLRGEFPAGKHRGEVVGRSEDRRLAYRHHGRFSDRVRPLLDTAPGGQPSGQFAYRLTKDGALRGGSSDCLPDTSFQDLIAQAAHRLRLLGDRIFAGEAAVDPYQRGSARACDLCPFQSICRIDPWTHAYRRLTARPAVASTGAEDPD